MRERIFVVEDDPGLRQQIVDSLSQRGYDVMSGRDGINALSLAIKTPFDLVILNMALPSMSGLEVCRILRDFGVLTPVLILTTRTDLDKLSKSGGGADDYLTKPFETDELLNRVGAILRRVSAHPRNHIYDVRGIRIDLKNATITRNGRVMDLSRGEARMLRYFLEHQGEMLTRTELLRVVWGYNFAPRSRTVDVHVTSLRQKLEEDVNHPQIIITSYGGGYRFIV